MNSELPRQRLAVPWRKHAVDWEAWGLGTVSLGAQESLHASRWIYIKFSGVGCSPEQVRMGQEVTAWPLPAMLCR